MIGGMGRVLGCAAGVAEAAKIAQPCYEDTVGHRVREESPMMDDQTLSNVWAPRLLAVLRIMAALLFLEHGLVKLFGFPPGAARGLQPLLSYFGIAGLIETVGGWLLLIGLFTRPVAFLLAGEMAVGYFTVHAPLGFYPALNAGDAAILFCFIFLYIAAAGPGAWSVDEMRAVNLAR
jgi:putative oxidoreductase